VAQGVVDDLDVVQVDEQCRQQTTQTFLDAQVDLQDVQDPGPVMQPGWSDGCRWALKARIVIAPKTWVNPNPAQIRVSHWGVPEE